MENNKPTLEERIAAARKKQRDKALKQGRLQFSLINSLFFAVVFFLLDQLFIAVKIFDAESIDEDKLVKLAIVFVFFFAYNYFLRWPRIVKTNL